MKYNVMYEPKTAKPKFQQFATFKLAMRYARKMAIKYCDHVWVYNNNDRHWEVNPFGKAKYY